MNQCAETGDIVQNRPECTCVSDVIPFLSVGLCWGTPLLNRRHRLGRLGLLIRRTRACFGVTGKQSKRDRTMTHVHSVFLRRALRLVPKTGVTGNAVGRWCLSRRHRLLSQTRVSGVTARIPESRGNTAQTINLDIGKQRRHRPMSASWSVPVLRKTRDSRSELVSPGNAED